jgi:ABC-2 type transport system permease protein
MTSRIVVATAGRVLRQLLRDRRTVALPLVVPGALLALTHQMIDSRPTFDRLALSLLGVFPFTTMFLITSVAMLRERTSGTLERLLTTPMSKLDLLLGYAFAAAAAAAAQAGVTCAVVYGPLGLTTPGSPALVIGIAVLGATMGMAVGLLASAFATSEFQAVQFMPAIVMPQILLGGLFVPRSQMADWLQHVSDVLPLTYDIDALTVVGSTSIVTGDLLRDLAVMAGTAVAALALAAATLRRRQGPMPRRVRRVLLAFPAAIAVASAVAGARLTAPWWPPTWRPGPTSPPAAGSPSPPTPPGSGCWPGSTRTDRAARRHRRRRLSRRAADRNGRRRTAQHRGGHGAPAHVLGDGRVPEGHPGRPRSGRDHRPSRPPAAPRHERDRADPPQLRIRPAAQGRRAAADGGRSRVFQPTNRQRVTPRTDSATR